MINMPIEDHIEKDENMIDWSKEYRLSWDDFEGTPESASETTARTYSMIYFDWKEEIFSTGTKYKFRIVEIEVKAVFSKSKSWKTETIFQQDKAQYFLNHEQGHFDLAEESARRLRERLTILDKKSYLCKGKNEQRRKKFAKKEAKKIVEKMYDSEFAKLRKLQKKYDSDTNHGWTKSKQRAWDNRFAKLRL